ncbi:hypothetical protein [Methanobrevibacter sp.]|uniref:hypothetical protein n=1 Tax=Methanobrevibacter sp. TaxID=66852 RepID=UPI003866AC12
MSVKQNFILGVFKNSKVSKVNTIISQYAVAYKDTTSYMYFAKQPIDTTNITNDIIFFQITAENKMILNRKVKNLINDLDELNTDYILKDYDSGEYLVTIKYGAKVTIKFDNVKFLKPGTFKKIDELKFINNDLGYCKGFKPNFRPLEGNSTENLEVLPEIIYITSDSEENLLKLRDYIFKKALEIDSNLETEFTWMFK